MQIEQATPAHIELIVPLFDGYRQFYRQASNPEAARHFLNERLVNADSVIFLATDDSLGVGFVQLYPSFSSVSMQRLWILNDIYVDPTARSQGIATALLARARQFAVDTGAKGLILATATSNTTAQRVYEQFGFLRDEEFIHYELYV